MPVFNFSHGSQAHGFTLTETGPLVAVEISIPTPLKAYLLAQGNPLPEPQLGFALVDTGAAVSAVDQSVFDALEIPPIDLIFTSTPHGEAESGVYPAAVTFPGLELTEMPMERLIGCHLK